MAQCLSPTDVGALCAQGSMWRPPAAPATAFDDAASARPSVAPSSAPGAGGPGPSAAAAGTSADVAHSRRTQSVDLSRPGPAPAPAEPRRPTAAWGEFDAAHGAGSGAILRGIL